MIEHFRLPCRILDELPESDFSSIDIDGGPASEFAHGTLDSHAVYRSGTLETFLLRLKEAEKSVKLDDVLLLKSESEQIQSLR